MLIVYATFNFAFINDIMLISCWYQVLFVTSGATSYALTFRRDVAKFSDYCLNQRLSHFVPLDTLFRLHFISNIILAQIQSVECMIYIMICHVKYVNLSST